MFQTYRRINKRIDSDFCTSLITGRVKIYSLPTKYADYLSLLHVCPHQFSHLAYQGCTLSFIFLVWPVYLQDLLFFAFFAEFGSSHALAFLILSLHTWAASVYFSQATCPCFHCLSIPFPIGPAAGPYWAMLVSCLPFLISYIRELLYEKCP